MNVCKTILSPYVVSVSGSANRDNVKVFISDLNAVIYSHFLPNLSAACTFSMFWGHYWIKCQITRSTCAKFCFLCSLQLHLSIVLLLGYFLSLNDQINLKKRKSWPNFFFWKFVKPKRGVSLTFLRVGNLWGGKSGEINNVITDASSRGRCQGAQREERRWGWWKKISGKIKKKKKEPKWNKDESSPEPGREYKTLPWNIHGRKESRAECKTPNSTCNLQ